MLAKWFTMKNIPTLVVLKDVADITSGYHFKTRFDDTPDGSYQVIQSKDVNNDGRLNTDALSRVNLEKVKDKYLISEGDIIFKAKTSTPVAGVVESGLENTVVTNHYFTLRIRNDAVSPDYLVWYLNSHHAKRYFDMNAAGTHFAAVNKKVLGELDVIIPTKKIQEGVVKIHSLWLSEREILNRISTLKEGLIKAQLSRAIKEV